MQQRIKYGTVAQRVRHRLIMACVRLLALWYRFKTLPSLDEAISKVGKHGETIITFPSRGTPGSCYVTADGQHYVRTGRGHRKVGTVVGKTLIARSKRIRRLAIARRVVAVVTIVTIITLVLILKLS